MINKFSTLYEVKYFSLGIFKNYLVFIPAKNYIKYFSGTTRIKLWKFNGMSEEDIENITKSPICTNQQFCTVFITRHKLKWTLFNNEDYFCP